MAANLKCIYGNKIKLQNVRTSETTEYTLVHYQEEKLDQNMISNYTPIGKAIWAKHEGAEVQIELMGREPELYKILSIENA